MKQGRSFILYYLIMLLLYFQQLDSAVITHMITKPIKAIYGRQHTANLLDWIPAHDHICKGYFKKSPIPENHQPTLGIKEPIMITVKGPFSMVTPKGVSILQQDVVVTQHDRIAEADKAYIYQDRKTDRVTKIVLIGHVRLHEAGKLIVANKGILTLYPQTATLMNVAYHIYIDESYFPKLRYAFDAWGIAKRTVHDSSGVTTLHNATYSTCNPTNPAWSISSTTLVLNRNIHQGEAYNMLFYLWNIPIFYFPYFNFPIDNYRKTGFLIPYGGYSSSSGWFFRFPFYWNIAPNCDLTLTPQTMIKRGFGMQILLRFLSAKSTGDIYLNYLFDDKAFQQFRNTTINEFPAFILAKHTDFTPYINQFKKMKNRRAFFSINETMSFNPKWISHVTLNYVTDPYFFQDLEGQKLINHFLVNQLLNQISLKYSGLNWQFTTTLQAYQTLHLINQKTNPKFDQYARLPDFNMNGYYPDITHNVSFNFNAEAVNFEYHSNFFPDRPRGQRFHVRPSVSFPIYFASGYMISQLWIDAIDYNVTHLQQGQTHTASRLLPIFDIDSGLFFDRISHFWSRTFIQTLEPRFFYLYVPYQNQERLPNFDTVLLPFSFEQLFGLNQFTGNDRLQNANQASLAITSQITNAQNGNPILIANIGFIYYIENQHVFLRPNCTPPPNHHFSPIIGELIFFPAPHWFFTSSLALDLNLVQMNNVSVQLDYNDEGKQVGLHYVFVHWNEDSVVTPTTTSVFRNTYNQDINQLILTSSWPLFEKYDAIGYWDYNITQHHTDIYSIGIQYDSCCWALNFSIRHTYTGLVPDLNGSCKRQYDTTFGFKLQLKGLALE